LEKNRRSFYKLEKKNGDKKVGHFGCTVEMRIQNSFQAYAKGRKMTNTIWGIKDQSGKITFLF
jgi:hypothetical protein